MVSRPKPSAPAPARWRYAGLLALALLLPPAAAGNTPAALREGVWSPVGKDTDGRECSARATRETPPEIPADQAISVACGRLDRAPNQIFVASATNEAVAAGWNRYRERVLNCGREEPLPFPAAGTQGRIWHCTPVNASWGYVALTVTIGERQYYAIGQGSAQPALLQAIGVASGRLATAPQSTPARGDSRILYERYMDDGRVYAAAEQYVKSEDAFRRALEIHQQVNGTNSPGATEVLLPLALILSNQGRMPEAERYFRDADALFRGQPSIAHGVHLAMHHANMHCFASAHSTLAKLETWLRSRLEGQDADPTDPRANADAARTGRRHDALNVQVTLSPTQATLTPAQFDEDLKTLLYLKAELQYRERLENTTRSRAMPTDCPPSPPKAQAQAQPTAGNPKDAAIRARQTLEMLNGMDKTPSEQAIVAFMLRTRSMTYLALDEPDPSPDDIGAAIEDLNQVIRILNKLNMQERPLAVAHLRLGKAHKLRGETDDALEHFEKGADLLLKHEQFATIDMLEPYIATLYEQSGRKGTDAAGLRQRMLVLQQLLGDGATARSIAAAATRAENRPTDTISEEEEIQHIREQRALIQTLRQARSGTTLVQAERELRDWENRRANRLRRQQQDAEARLLRQRDEHARLALSMPDTSQPRIAELDTSNQQLLADIERIKAELNDLPRAALLTQGIIQPERLFNQMQPDEAIVTFFVGHRHTYGMRVNSDRTMEAWRTDLTLEQATQWVDDIIASVAVPPGSKIRPYPVTKAHSLYVGLFGQDMQRVQGVETMTIVADNVLARLPFSALVTGDISRHTENDTETKSELNQLRQTRWLIDTVAVAHASSLKSLVLLRELATDVTPSEKYYIGFSTPDQASDLQFDMLAYGAAPPASGMSSDGLLDSDQLRCAEEARWIRNLGPLPHAPEEIDEVRKRLNLPASSSLTGTSFRRQTLMNRDMAGYRILHFASHAVLPQPQHTCIREPALQISPDPEPADARSGMLTMSEIEHMTLNADLVVLSACDSGGAGSVESQEALSGLARAFFYANARGLVVSAWAVNDQSTKHLILQMMTIIGKENKSPAKALRDAQLHMINNNGDNKDLLPNYIHPYYWAPFIATGNVTQGIPMTNISLDTPDT